MDDLGGGGAQQQPALEDQSIGRGGVVDPKLGDDAASATTGIRQAKQVKLDSRREYLSLVNMGLDIGEFADEEDFAGAAQAITN